MSLVLLSENSEYQYLCVAVPKEATEIKVEYLDGFNEWVLNYDLPNDKWSEDLDCKDPVILGVIGGNVTDQNSIEKGHYYNLLVSLLAGKGILVENPIEKPLELHRTDSYYEEGGMERFEGEIESYREDYHQWQSYESRLVKAVILKVKK